MAARRIVVLAVATLTLATLAPTAGAESRAECAQRVIRDWYTGGRVDGVYPLACYRAAIAALPSDVLHYSDADRDIARALAFARKGLNDPGNAAPQQQATATAPGASAAQSDRREPAPAPVVRAAARPPKPAVGSRVRLASGPEPVPQGSAVPYPVLALAALSAILLASAAVGWLAARRR